MKKSNFVGGIWLVGYENGEKFAEVDISTISNDDLNTIITYWTILNVTWLFDLRF